MNRPSIDIRQMLRRLALVWARRRAAKTLLREGVVTRGGEASGEAARAETKGHVFDRKAFVAARRAALRGAAEEGAGEDVVPEALVEKQGSAASAALRGTSCHRTACRRAVRSTR